MHGSVWETEAVKIESSSPAHTTQQDFVSKSFDMNKNKKTKKEKEREEEEEEGRKEGMKKRTKEK